LLKPKEEYFNSPGQEVNLPSELGKLARWARQTAAASGVIWRYGIVVAAVFAATGVRLAFNPVLGAEAPHVPFAFAVIVAARFGGRGPGLAATALSTLAVDWFFLQPLHSLAVANPKDLWGLSLFAVTGSLIALLVGRLRELLLLRTRAEEALRASQARFEFVLEAANLGAWELDLTSLRAWRSPQHDAIFGYHALLPEWTYDMFLEHVLPEDREEVARKLRQATDRGVDLQFDCRIRRADGAVRWISAQGKSLPDAEGRPLRLSGIVRDVTDRWKMEEDLRQSGEQFRTLANAMPQLCGMANPDGWFFWLNQRWNDYTGLAPKQSEGWGWSSALDPESSREALEHWRHSIAAGEPFESVFSIRGADGVVRPFLSRASPVRDRECKVSARLIARSLPAPRSWRRSWTRCRWPCSFRAIRSAGRSSAIALHISCSGSRRAPIFRNRHLRAKGRPVG
jgi:PAS domain S-box-containing protein